ncbi:MAG: hypothetical protein JST41_02190 [Bacteroidetes bacterium]|nr:hypothetical protein [Bacteroidota bacterium]MBX7127862.1 hypothetical protein [Flavobacteriales bacterium]MCC6654586.1 hypothetical protein [Flavobacteriales bacterium]HMW95928.1 hypothetical protein [Flavobacteriales bacterium]HMZ47653.1 hypothetical protein [Flavobacteriales bacterium]
MAAAGGAGVGFGWEVTTGLAAAFVGAGAAFLTGAGLTATAFLGAGAGFFATGLGAGFLGAGFAAFLATGFTTFFDAGFLAGVAFFTGLTAFFEAGLAAFLGAGFFAMAIPLFEMSREYSRSPRQIPCFASAKAQVNRSSSST